MLDQIWHLSRQMAQESCSLGRKHFRAYRRRLCTGKWLVRQNAAYFAAGNIGLPRCWAANKQ
jgi:hypothetical protein